MNAVAASDLKIAFENPLGQTQFRLANRPPPRWGCIDPLAVAFLRWLAAHGNRLKLLQVGTGAGHDLVALADVLTRAVACERNAENRELAQLNIRINGMHAVRWLDVDSWRDERLHQAMRSQPFDVLRLTESGGTLPVLQALASEIRKRRPIVLITVDEPVARVHELGKLSPLAVGYALRVLSTDLAESRWRGRRMGEVQRLFARRFQPRRFGLEPCERLLVPGSTLLMYPLDRMVEVQPLCEGMAPVFSEAPVY